MIFLAIFNQQKLPNLISIMANTHFNPVGEMFAGRFMIEMTEHVSSILFVR